MKIPCSALKDKDFKSGDKNNTEPPENLVKDLRRTGDYHGVGQRYPPRKAAMTFRHIDESEIMDFQQVVRDTGHKQE